MSLGADDGAGSTPRTLARELREVIAACHTEVVARWHEPGGCTLDLHRPGGHSGAGRGCADGAALAPDPLGHGL